MAYCMNCGTQVEDDIKFCPSCGSPVSPSSPNQNKNSANNNVNNATSSFENKFNELNNTKDSTADFDKADIDQNKAMGIMAYCGPLVLIPLLSAPKSKFARFHASQGLTVLIGFVAIIILNFVVAAILPRSIYRLIGFVFSLGNVALGILEILGIVNAINGKAKELPLIGSFKLLK